jgi:hypothetical protein
MSDKEELCKKIMEIYPDIGQCDIDVDVFYSTAKQSWIVELQKDGHKLQHHLAKHDAKDCLEGKECVALGLEIAQLKKNIKGEQF